MKHKIINYIAGYDASAWVEDGRPMFRFGDEQHPLDEWTRDRILDLANKHFPDYPEHYAWLTTVLLRHAQKQLSEHRE